MRRPRIAVAGAGYIGLAHLDAIARSERAALAAIVDPAQAAQRLGESWRIPVYPSLEALLSSEPPDAIVLATPNALHVEQALQCIAAGLPVLLEKPIATELTDAQRLVDEVERCGARLLIGHHRAHSPIMARAREVIESGRLGRLVSVMGSATFMKPDEYFSQAPWRRQRGAGPILLNLIHEVHNLRMLCGEIVAVQAFASHAVRGFEVEDSAAISLRFANGALGTFMLSDTAASARSWEQTSQENKAYSSYPDEDCYVIAGTLGSLSVPTMRLKTYATPGEASWWKPFASETLALQRDDPIRRQMAHFIDLVEGRIQPLVSARDGLQNLKITIAIAEAAQTGQTVPT